MAGKQRTPSAQAAPDHRLNRNGNHTLERERVTGIQRTRMLAAMTEVASEHGAANVTVAQVVERAGVSRRTFYEIFDDIEGCLLAAIDEAISRTAQRVLPAYRAAGRWREQIRAGLTALLQLFDEDPRLARLLVVETLGGDRRALERRTRVLDPVIAAILAGGGEAKTVPATRLSAEGVVGAVLAVIHNRLVEGDRGRLLELVNPLMSMIALPYLGPAAARRELERAATEPAGRRQAAMGNPLREIHMRLTYRTLRVLMAVAAGPGSSNRAIADAAEVSDQGQISKLLTRLQRLGLIENAGARVARGEPNAWALTARGAEVYGALAAGPAAQT